MKIKLLLLAISNIFMLNIVHLFDLLGMKRTVKIIVDKATQNTNYIESIIGGNNNE